MTFNDKPRRELWLEPASSAHGHFHVGDKLLFQAVTGFNMKPDAGGDLSGLRVFLQPTGASVTELTVKGGSHGWEIQGAAARPGTAQIWAELTDGPRMLLAKTVVEIMEHGDAAPHHGAVAHDGQGHFHTHAHHHAPDQPHGHQHPHHHGHHHGQPQGHGPGALIPLRLPLEIHPLNFGEARLGRHLQLQILRGGAPLAGAELKGTWAGTHNAEYPITQACDAEGRAAVFLSSPSSFLFVARYGDYVSTLYVMN